MLVWDQPLLGTLDLELERIDRVRLPRSIIGAAQPAPLQPATTDDILLLNNGDRLEGFLTRAGAAIGFEVGGREVSIELGAIDQYAVANPPEPMTGPIAWLRDGSVIPASDVRVRGGLATLHLGAASPGATQSEAVPSEPTEADTEASSPRIILDEGTLIGLAAQAERLRPLASLESSVGADAAAARAEVLGSTVTIDRPGRVVYELPEGASWFAADAVLPLRARIWGDITLAVIADDQELASVRLTADKPTQAIRVPLRGAQELAIELRTGGFGEVQAFALLDAALVAIDDR